MPLDELKTIKKKTTASRGRGTILSESSSYVPSRDVSEENSAFVQEEHTTTHSRPHGRHQFRDELSSSYSTSEGSESASQSSEPSDTPVPKAHVIYDIHDDDGKVYATTTDMERSKKKEVLEDRFVSLAVFNSFYMWWLVRSLTLERQFLLKYLGTYNRQY